SFPSFRREFDSRHPLSLKTLMYQGFFFLSRFVDIIEYQQISSPSKLLSKLLFGFSHLNKCLYSND
ncbi:hypothetical protein, partial [Enterococcus asini]|uniref:hypothetical protein n=1 Tax=Enterococcus asini TaxID=57732 RepID=UPI0026DC7380